MTAVPRAHAALPEGGDTAHVCVYDWKPVEVEARCLQWLGGHRLEINIGSATVTVTPEQWDTIVATVAQVFPVTAVAS